MSARFTSRFSLACAASLLLAWTAGAQADLQPAWISRLPIGFSLSAGLGGMVVDSAGVTYMTGTGGSSSNVDIITTAFGPDGAELWTSTFNGTYNWHDQGRGITIGVDGSLWVCGNTPAADSRAKVLALKYDRATGALLQRIEYTSDPFYAEHAQSIAVDAAGNVYVGGGTNGDGSDVYVLSFNPAGNLRWRKTWDGLAFGPFSQDHLQQLALAPDGNLVAMIDGVAANNHADYVLIKYNAGTGATIWETHWGLGGDDFPNEMIIDTDSDIYVCGIALALEGNDRYGTIRVRGGDGAIMWENYAGRDYHNAQRGFSIDGRGGVYVTGSVDPDGDRSNANDNFYSVKLDADTGSQLWSHSYGANCLYCSDIPGDIVADSAGNVLLAGTSLSAPYSGHMLLFVLDSGTGIETDRGVLAPTQNEGYGIGSLVLDAQENLLIGGGTVNVNTGEKNYLLIKYDSLSGGSYALTVQNLVGGSDAAFTIINATPSVNQYIVYSLRGLGSTFVP
ncbi:MAG: PQQ-binding-like beta-propeller repeat protein, partial [Phycisphaerales bacterium]|nr:PQQ-binding-like beta-propeller repeat protein [Phycisphaerales bacterium]